MKFSYLFLIACTIAGTVWLSLTGVASGCISSSTTNRPVASTENCWGLVPGPGPCLKVQGTIRYPYMRHPGAYRNHFADAFGPESNWHRSAVNSLEKFVKDNGGTSPHFKASLAANNNGASPSYSNPGLIIPLARTITTDTISLIRNLTSFDSSKTLPSERINEFVKSSFNILKKLAMENEAIAGDLWGTAAELSMSKPRSHRRKEIRRLKRMGSNILSARDREVDLIKQVIQKIPDPGAIDQGCRDAMARLKDAENVGNNTTSIKNAELGPDNIYSYVCTSRMKMEAMSDLAAFINLEIAKKWWSSTQANFYSIAFKILGHFLDASHELNFMVADVDQFNYDHPSNDTVGN